MNEIVKYHNNLSNQIVIKTLNANELNFFMAICSKMRDKGENEIVFTFSQLKELVKWISNDNVDFLRSLQNTNKKLIALNFRFEDEREIVQFVLFPTFRINKEDKTLTVKVNEEFSFLLNNLSSNFTRFELENFTSLQSKYSKYLYKELMKFKSTGYATFKIEEFREKLDIPTKYRMTHINQKVLSPAAAELSKVFQKFEIKKIKKGRAITNIEFYFSLRKEKIQENIIESEVIEVNPVDVIKKIWKDSFPGVNYTKKHQTIIEKSLKIMTESQVINYLQEQWEYVKNNIAIENGPAYFSSLILDEKAVLKDYEKRNKRENITLKEERTQAEDFVRTLFDSIEEKEITDKNSYQPPLFNTQKTKKEKQKITEQEYENIYIKYLRDNDLKHSSFFKKRYDKQNKEKYIFI